MTGPQTKGADWVNLSIIEDYSTDKCTFEIHLSIPIDSADVATIRRHIADAKAADDEEYEPLKELLRARAGVDNTPAGGKTDPDRSKKKMIKAILVKM